MASVVSSTQPWQDMDTQQPSSCTSPGGHAPLPSPSLPTHNHHVSSCLPLNNPSSSATHLASHPPPNFPHESNNKGKVPQDPMPSSSLPSTNLSRTSASMVLELSDSDEERFLSGLDDQIKDVSMEPRTHPKSPQASSSRPSQAPPRRVHVIDLTRFDSPPSTSSLKRRTHASLSSADKKTKVASHIADVSDEPIGESCNTAVKASSSGVVLDLDDELSCPICCEIFVSPVNFECGHAFCGSCADAWLEKESVCPTCRRETHSPPARMYTMDATLQKYLNYQAELLRQSDKPSEALALELEYQERQAHWSAQRKRLEAKATASRRAMTRFASARHPVTLPHMNGFGSGLYSPYPREIVPLRVAHERQPVMPPVEQTIRPREREPVGWHQARHVPIGPTYQLLPQRPVEATNRMASGSNNNSNNQQVGQTNNHHRPHPNEAFDHVDRAWDQLGPFFAQS